MAIRKNSFNRTAFPKRVHKHCGIPIGNPAIFYSNLARVTRLVAEGVAQGLSVKEMANKYAVPENHVKACLARHSLRRIAEEKMEQVTATVLKTKLPMLQEIAGLTLATVREYFHDLVSDPEKKAKLSIDDIKKLADVAKNINELARLEEGKSTQNVHSVHEVAFKVEKDVTVLLDSLKKNDPFVEYPAIENGTESTEGAEPVSPDSDGPAQSLEGGEEVSPSGPVSAT